MKKWWLYNILFFLCVTASYPQEYFSGRVVVKVKETFHKTFLQQPDFVAFLSEIDADTVIRKFPRSIKNKQCADDKHCISLDNIYEIRFSPETVLKTVLSKLRKMPYFYYAEPIPVARLTYTPNDPLITNQNHLAIIKAYDAWNYTKSSPTIVIGIVDSGTDIYHEDLTNKIHVNSGDPIDGIDNDGDGHVDNYYGWNFSDNSNNVSDDINHGVHVSGIAAADTDNNTGVAGVGFHASILPVKVNDGSSVPYGYDGIVYAAEHGAHIINCSWAGGGGNYGHDIIKYATYNYGALVVASAGNNNNDVVNYPAGYPEVMAVTGTMDDDTRLTNASYGYHIDIAAPGKVYATYVGNNYGMNGGTSMSAPVVSGAAALLKAVYPAYTPFQLKSLLKAGADNIDTITGNENVYGQMGAGRLNILQSLNTSNPYIELANSEIKDLNDSVFTDADTFQIHLSFVNLLEDATNIQVKIFSDSLVQCIDSSYYAGQMLYGDTITMLSPFTVKIKKSTGYDTKITLPVYFYESNNLVSRHYVVFSINKTYLNIDFNNVFFTVTSNGAIGYNKFNQREGVGIGNKNKGSQAWEASLMIGKNYKVSDNARDSLAAESDNDFKIIKPVYSRKYNNYLIAETWFNDSLSEDVIGITVHQLVSVTDNPGHENYALFKYTFYNNSTVQPLTGLYAGIFVDWDINDYTNTAVVHKSRQIAYSYDNDASYPYCGVQLLTPSGFHAYSIANNGSENNGINLYDGFNNNEKFYALANDAYTAGLNSPKDISQTTSYGPFSILPGDSVEVFFAVHITDNVYQLMQSADSAYFKINATFPAHTTAQKRQNDIFVIPNPSFGEIQIQAPQYIESIEVIDISGKLHELKQFDGNMHSLQINLEQKGFYFLKIKTSDGQSYIKKVVIY